MGLYRYFLADRTGCPRAESSFPFRFDSKERKRVLPVMRAGSGAVRRKKHFSLLLGLAKRVPSETLATERRREFAAPPNVDNGVVDGVHEYELSEIGDHPRHGAAIVVNLTAVEGTEQDKEDGGTRIGTASSLPPTMSKRPRSLAG